MIKKDILSKLDKKLKKNYLFLIFIILGINFYYLTSLKTIFAQEIIIEKSLENNEDDSIQSDEYIIGPGDVVELTLLDDKQFSGEYKVLNDGTVNFPLIGSVRLDLLTLQQASEMVQKKYSKELLRPELYLMIKVPRPIMVSIVGAIERPGIYSLTNNERTQTVGGPLISNSGSPTLIDAIQKAGGISQEVDLRNVYIKRKLPGKDSGYKVAKIDLVDLIFEGNHSQNPYLFDGDIIKLMKANNIDQEIYEVSKANLSPSQISVNIVGKVYNPGRFDILANTPLSQAILIAGGTIDWKANKGNVELIRININGTATRKKYKIDLTEGIVSDTNPPLKNGDIVKVNSSVIGGIGSGISAVTEPMSGLVTALSLFKLLN